jgi:hypothetical protein
MTEDHVNAEDSKFSKVAMIIFVIALIFCSLEVVPGWGLFDLEWPPSIFYAIMAAAGALYGAAIAKMRVIGAVCGVISGVGAIGLTQLLLQNVNWIPGKAIVIAAAIGAIPGFGLYLLAEKLLSPKPLDPEDAEPTDPHETL